MRDRNTIETQWRGEPVTPGNYRPDGRMVDGLILEVLLDIRDLLESPPVEIVDGGEVREMDIVRKTNH